MLGFPRANGKLLITKEGFLRRAFRIMESLRTDYLGCLMISGPETVEIQKNKEFHAATEQLKKEDRLKLVGVSHHGSQLWDEKPKGPMGKILLAAAEDGRFDDMFLAYNFLKEDKSEQVLEVCSQKNIGTTLMKTNPIRSYNEWKEYYERTLISKGEELSEEEREVLARMEKKMEDAQGFLKRHNHKSQEEMRQPLLPSCLRLVCAAMPLPCTRQNHYALRSLFCIPRLRKVCHGQIYGP